ncbi:hypothetical protein TREES_T100014012 [Tupaia chinensis]|uniref:Uncharacterized protein n=1 Tax=Tupaia chinensis TaxID=246437 RepID=L9KQW1_TUPCH|nr:hypothetical protein TREES_T100014012 [Tupaia chinensis]
MEQFQQFLYYLIKMKASGGGGEVSSLESPQEAVNPCVLAGALVGRKWGRKNLDLIMEDLSHSWNGLRTVVANLSSNGVTTETTNKTHVESPNAKGAKWQHIAKNSHASHIGHVCSDTDCGRSKYGQSNKSS